MKNEHLGFDQWFAQQAAEFNINGRDIARVSAVDRGAYRVRNSHGEVPAEPAGRFYFRIDSAMDLPCVGDWVGVQYHSNDTAAIIHDVLPRKTFLRRKRAGTDVDFQMIAANIDTAFIIQSCHFDFNLRRMDRYLVMAADGGVKSVIVLTKTDLVSGDELAQKQDAIAQAGIAAGVIALSNVTGGGVEEFRQMLLPGQTYCLLGSSGVGKTTLINRLLGHAVHQTGEVSGTGEGSHTTARRQLILLAQGAMLIDTPGMRELGLIGAADGIKQGFEDIFELALNCRFGDCSHTREKGCAVLAAIKSGELSEQRYVSFMKLKKESEHYDLSYADRRKKDRAFGRIVKSAVKAMKDR